MSNGDDESAEPPAEADETEPDAAGDDEAGGDEAAEEAPTLEDALADVAAALDADDLDEEALETALDAAESAVEAAETEADLDEVESALDDVEAALEDADLPEPDEDDEEAEDPRAALEEGLADRREAVEAARGPYAEDVAETVREAATRVADTRWTETGEADVADAVASFLAASEEAVDADAAAEGEDTDALAGALEETADAVAESGLDPDDDADTIAALVEAADALEAGLEDAQEWSDLSTREQLEAEGFYDVLDHRKDYPPEWSALKEHEKRGNADMVLLALEKLGSEFMEEHCLDALRRMGPEAAVEPMLERADRRDRPAIEILGKIASDEAVDTIVEYVETESDPQLQKTTLKALGEIGSEEATQAVANALAMEDDEVRSAAARALGMIGDPHAVEPLADVLEDDDADTVRASAAWALVQIGTESALAAASEHASDRSVIVSSEAEKAAAALDAEPA